MAVNPIIRSFRDSDIPAACDLARAEGWNQLPADWTRLVTFQDGCFVAEIDDRLVGTITTTCYGQQVAWIGMMLVHAEYRRRGFATALMNAALVYLRAQGVRSIQLDATPAGRQVYANLGFQAEWDFHRWLRSPPATAAQDEADRSSTAKTPDDLQSVAEIDTKAFGADRSEWLSRLAADSRVRCQTGGYGMLRPGQRADYLGPLIATDPEIAAEIAETLLAGSRTDHFWDIPGPNDAAVRLARQLGFRPVRDLTRMRLGAATAPRLHWQYAMGDPGTG